MFWRESESEVERRNGKDYDSAAAMLADLAPLSARKAKPPISTAGSPASASVHERKGKFIERSRGL
ncbi:hypothetical protein [Sinorhizobium arboris]|uniref:hypothetical protein n=1 Tax=Sinorhizobium arboris TaxID=76745 RepID=UPI0003FDBF51|nr:hypothetical protein [Sinorhizobium arboris]